MDGFPKAIRLLGMGGLCAWPSLVMVLPCFLTGCSPAATAPQEVAEPAAYVGDMAAIQGNWGALPAVGFDYCLAKVDGYRIQIEFKYAGDQPKVRLNKVFERVDERSHCLMLAGGRGVWPYELFEEGGDGVLELEFYDSTGATWHTVRFVKND